MTLFRHRLKTFGQTTMFETPVSSSRVRKITPLAVPGRCLVMTRPTTVTWRPSGVLRIDAASRKRPSCGRRSDTGWPRKVSRIET